MDMMTAIFAANKAKKEIQASGGVGYEEVTSSVELVPNASYEFSGGAFMLPVSQQINAGDEVTTVIDGTEYKAAAKSITQAGMTAVYAGNGAAVGLVDTGEPYLTMVAVEDETLKVVVVLCAELGGEETTNHTVSVVAKTVEVHPIDPKYLPPLHTVVDITDVITAYSDNAAATVSLDDARLAAILEGVEKKNLVLMWTETSVLGGAQSKSFCNPIAYFVDQGVNNAGGAIMQIILNVFLDASIKRFDISISGEGNGVFISNV